MFSTLRKFSRSLPHGHDVSGMALPVSAMNVSNIYFFYFISCSLGTSSLLASLLYSDFFFNLQGGACQFLNDNDKLTIPFKNR